MKLLTLLILFSFNSSAFSISSELVDEKCYYLIGNQSEYDRCIVELSIIELCSGDCDQNRPGVNCLQDFYCCQEIHGTINHSCNELEELRRND